MVKAMRLDGKGVQIGDLVRIGDKVHRVAFLDELPFFRATLVEEGTHQEAISQIPEALELITAD